MSEQYKMVAENPQSTVVSDYEPRYRNAKQYQSEAEMEKEFIEQLQTQAYDYLPINSEKELIENLRRQLEKLNGYRFTDKEWTAFFKEKIANQNSGIVEKTAIVQDDYIQLLTREDGSTKNIYLLDKKDVFRGMGLWALRLQFTTENPGEIDKILMDYQGRAAFDAGSYTRGLYSRGVE